LDVVVGHDVRNLDNQQREIGVTGVARFDQSTGVALWRKAARFGATRSAGRVIYVADAVAAA